MKKILWISRHAMNKQQLEDLKRVYGDIQLIEWKENVDTIEEIMPLIAQADAIAAVLPLFLLHDLKQAAGDKQVLLSVAKRTLVDGKDEKQVIFGHDRWIEITELKLKYRDI